MASKSVRGQFVKNCGTSFKHTEWKVPYEDNLLDRRHIKLQELNNLDKIYKNKQYTCQVSYCKGCVKYVENTVIVGKIGSSQKVDASSNTDIDDDIIAGYFFNYDV